MPAGVSKFLTNSGELSSQDEYVRIWPKMAIYVCKITVLGPMPFTYRGRSLTVAAQQVCRFSNFYRFTDHRIQDDLAGFAQPHMHRIRVAEQVVQVAQDLLVGAQPHMHRIRVAEQVVQVAQD